MELTKVSLDDKYTATSGRVYLTGIQALVRLPISQHLRDVAAGHLDTQMSLQRPDEFGLLISEFNRMIRELREKEQLRETFGLHVGRQAAERIMAAESCSWS